MEKEFVNLLEHSILMGFVVDQSLVLWTINCLFPWNIVLSAFFFFY